MARAGRKSKMGPRHACGKLIQGGRTIDVRLVAIAHPDRQDVPERLRHDQHAATQLGRMFLRNQITAEELEASRRYAKDSASLHAAIGAPSPNPQSLNPATAGGRGQPLLFSASEIRRRRERYDDAHCVLTKISVRVAKVVSRMAMYDEALDDLGTFEDLKAGLRGLVEHYGLIIDGKVTVLTGGRKSFYFRNA